MNKSRTKGIYKLALYCSILSKYFYLLGVIAIVSNLKKDKLKSTNNLGKQDALNST